jgi:hypothetical protein
MTKLFVFCDYEANVANREEMVGIVGDGPNVARRAVLDRNGLGSTEL